MKKNYRNPMTRPENFMNPAGNVILNFQPGIALKASRAGNLHVIGTLNLCFSHTHIMFFRKFKSCL